MSARMRSGLGLLLALALGALTWSPASAAALEAYGRLPSIEMTALSGDGSLVAVVTAVGDKRVLAIRKVGETKNAMAILVGASKIRDLRWVGSSHLLVTVSLTTALFDLINPREEWYSVLDLNLKARTQMNILQGARDSVRAAISPPSIRILGGHPYAFVEAYHMVDNLGRDSVYRVNLDTGQIDLIAVGKPETEGWLMDRDGQPVAERRYDAASSKYALRVRRSGDDWRTVDEGSSSFGAVGVLGLGRDGRSVVSSDYADGHVALHELAPSAATWGEPFGMGDRELIYDAADERLIGLHALVGDTDEYTFFAAADQASWDAAAKSFPNARVTLGDFSADHTKLVVKVDSPTDGPSYAVYDVAAHAVLPIGPAYAALTPDDIAPVQPVRFKAQDGLALTGYLTLPRGRDPKSLPLVVFPHGGPAARDEPGFDWWAQAMASHGYAVLQVNYRGSDGFGDAFLQAGFGQWGRKMQTDLSDGVRYLAGQGTIDPKRVCIVGASYGGYAALAGATLDPGVYRCAVDVSGISDMRRFVDWSAQQGAVVSRRYWSRYIGASAPNDPVFAQVSPLDHIDAVTAPILIIHGKDDTVVPLEQSQIMADALKKAGKPYDFVILSHEDHWLSSSDTRLEMLQATVDFLAKNNPAE
jgi:dipeptidyl aminopeptidase/acylaminoacyl peptidase